MYIWHVSVEMYICHVSVNCSLFMLEEKRWALYKEAGGRAPSKLQFLMKFEL